MEFHFLLPSRHFWIRNALLLKILNIQDIEKRYYCFGKVDGAIITVRFTYKGQTIRIFGAGYWRKGGENL